MVTRDDNEIEVGDKGTLEESGTDLAMDDEDDDNMEEYDDYYSESKNPRRSRLVALILGLLALAGIGVAVYFILDKKEVSFSKEVNPNFMGTVSLSMLEEHDTPEDCWLLIHGSVYDLTEYAWEHPGGPEWIHDWCGRDGTRAIF